MPDSAPLGLAPHEHAATRMVGLSFDSAASPHFGLAGFDPRRQRAYGWGFAWYPDDGSAAQVIKDATSVGENAMTKLLREWERFESTTFVAHLRGATRALTERDTQPFARPFGPRIWVFAHNGDLTHPDGSRDLGDPLPLGNPACFEPVGRTDSERAFCWLLGRAFEAGARSLFDVGWERLHAWFRHLDGLGTANLIVSDGQDLVAYSDESDYNRLHHARFVPPNVPKSLPGTDLVVNVDDARVRTRTVVAFSTRPLGEDGFSPFLPGQMLVARRGGYIYDSHASPEDRKMMVVPLGPLSEPQSAEALDSGPQRPSVEQTQAAGDLQPEPSPSRSAVEAEENDATSDLPAAPESPSNPPAPSNPREPQRVVIPADHHFARAHPGRLLTVLHETTYTYELAVEKSEHLFRLQPIHDRWQDVLTHELFLSVDGRSLDYEDVFGNKVTKLGVDTPFRQLTVRAQSLVRVRGYVSPDLQAPDRRTQIPLVWMPWQRQMMTPYLLPPELPETQLRELSAYAMSFVERQDYDLVQTLLDMNIAIYRDYAYVSGSTTMATTPFQVFSKRRGVCQDFANLLICLARLLGIPARYRVGYIFTGANYENQVQSDASHAWAELYLPWLGWQGFDPTNGCLVNEDHVRVACGRNYGDATPTSGTLFRGGGGERLEVRVEVEEAKPASS